MSSMTLEQVRDWHRAREASFANSKSKLFSKEDARAKRKHRQMADAIDAQLTHLTHLTHLTQPAQPVDVCAVLLKSLGGYLERNWPDNPINYDELADKLTAALREKGNG